MDCALNKLEDAELIPSVSALEKINAIARRAKRSISERRQIKRGASPLAGASTSSDVMALIVSPKCAWPNAWEHARIALQGGNGRHNQANVGRAHPAIRCLEKRTPVLAMRLQKLPFAHITRRIRRAELDAAGRAQPAGEARENTKNFSSNTVVGRSAGNRPCSALCTE